MPWKTEWLCKEMADCPEVRVGAPVGFPSGADSTAIKVAGAIEQKAYGCKEFDMVINVGALKSGKYDYVRDDIKAIADIVEGDIFKTIIEAPLLTDYEIQKASEIAVSCGVTFVKTGTGWAKTPSTVHHVELIKDAIGDAAQIKAAGGVRTIEHVVDMVNAGCSRFGIGIASIKSILDAVDKGEYVCRDIVIE